jgi:AAHS family cis,cis-muconate transporter-like MFS transporter
MKGESMSENQNLNTKSGEISFRDIPFSSYKIFFICLIGVTFANLDHQIFILVQGSLSKFFGWTPQDFGLYSAITFLVSGFLCSQIGVISDRMGRKKSLLVSTLLTPLFVAYLAFAPNTVAVLIARTLGFTTAGAQSPITLTTVTESSPARFRGLFTGILQIGFPLGAALAALLISLILNEDGSNFQYTFLLALLFLPYGWIIHKYLPESKAWLDAQKNKKESDPKISTLILFKPKWRRKSLLLFAGQFLYAFAYGSTFLLPFYLQLDRAFTETEAISMVGQAYAIGSLGYIVAAVVGEFLISRRNTIVLWALLGGCAFTALIWLAQTPAQIILTFSMMSFFFYGAYAVMATFIAENFPAELRATAASFSGTLAINSGFGLGPLAIGIASASFGWNEGFTIIAIAPIILAAIIFMFLKPVPREEVF